jgi:hypothetical protein
MRRFTYAAACLFVTCGAWAVPIALAVATRVAAAAEPSEPAQVRPLAVSCDGRAGVAALVIQVDKPGTYSIAWDNRRVCGTAV